MKPHLRLAPLILIGTTLLFITGALLRAPFYAAPGHRAMLPAAPLEATATAVPGTVSVLDKYAAVRARSTQAAAIPSATIYWPYPTPIPLSIPLWPPGTRQTPLGAGIIYDGQPPMGSWGFTLKSAWAELLEDRVVYVDTGGKGYMGDGTQGALFISARTLSNDLISEDIYRTPTKAGPVTITDAVGERLTLEAADGTRFTFDVATRQWVNP